MIKKSIFLSFHPTDHKISRLSQYKKLRWASCFVFTTVWCTCFFKRKIILRQFDVPVSWKERLFYFQRDYAIFISLQCINFRPTEYEGFETEPLFVCFCVLFWLLLLFFFLNISFFHNLILMTITIAQEILFLKNDIFYFFLRFFV